MTVKTLILASITLLTIGGGAAISGPCTVEIDGLAKSLAAKDAGSGPTAGAAGAAGTPPAPSASGQHPPTAVMRQETEGKAASPEDVRRQTAGQPTAAQQGVAPPASRPAEAGSVLDRAREFDAQGKEAECMAAVREARGLVGPR